MPEMDGVERFSVCMYLVLRSLSVKRLTGGAFGTGGEEVAILGVTISSATNT